MGLSTISRVATPRQSIQPPAFADPDLVRSFTESDIYLQHLAQTGVDLSVLAPRRNGLAAQINQFTNNPTRWHSGILTGERDLRIYNPDKISHDLSDKRLGGSKGGLYGGLVDGLYGGLVGGLYGGVVGGVVGGLVGGLYGLDSGLGGSLGGVISGVGSAISMAYGVELGHPGLGFAGALASYTLGIGVSFLVSAMPRFFENLKATKEESAKLLALKSEAEKLDLKIEQSTSYTGVIQKLRDDLPLMRRFLDEFVRGNLSQDNAAIETEIAQLEARKVDLESRLEARKITLNEYPKTPGIQAVIDALEKEIEKITDHLGKLNEEKKRYTEEQIGLLAQLKSVIQLLDGQIRHQTAIDEVAKDFEVIGQSQRAREVSETAQQAREIFLQELAGTMKALTTDAQAAHAARLEVGGITAGFLER